MLQVLRLQYTPCCSVPLSDPGNHNTECLSSKIYPPPPSVGNKVLLRSHTVSTLLILSPPLIMEFDINFHNADQQYIIYSKFTLIFITQRPPLWSSG